jgi:3-hydroxyacyl-[acyl-carrier-protein] dehydratase
MFALPCCHQDASEIPEMMEEEKPLADADTPSVDVHPTMNMPLLSPPTQGHEVEAAAHGITMSTESGSKSSEPPFTADQAAPMEMDIEDDVRQPQPGQHPQFWSGE